jgi:hypothetical protein
MMSTRILTFIAVIALFFSCKNDVEELSCDQVLFGIPNESTGLSSAECVSVCTCKGYEPRVFSATEIETLKTWELTEPFEGLSADPYNSTLPPEETGVCAIIVENFADKKYRLQSFNSEAEAVAAGAFVTHLGPCKLCSTLQDLAIYIENRDLGTSVRECSIDNLLTPFPALVSCIKNLGFSDPCAQIWAYNARNTQRNCFEPCISALLSETIFNVTIPYNNPDGTLSPCILCDEEISGPIFKAYAGRTRRNSGIPVGICRFCDEVIPIAHNYPF